MKNAPKSGINIGTVLIMGTILTLFYIVYVVFIMMVLMWLLKLEKIDCTCALGWKRNYLIFYIVFSVLIIILNLMNVTVPAILSSVLSIFGILFIIIAYDYVKKLEKDKCNCSNAFARDLLYAISVIYGLLILVGLIMIAINVTSFKMLSNTR